MPIHLPSDEIQTLISKRLETDVKVYRAFNKTHIFFTVFGKPCEERIQAMLGDAGEHKFEANFETLNEKHNFRLINYTRFEEEVRKKIHDADMIRDELPEYIQLLNI